MTLPQMNVFGMSSSAGSDETSEVVKLRIEEIDPYLDNLGDFEFEYTDDEEALVGDEYAEVIEDVTSDETEDEIGDQNEDYTEESDLNGTKPYIGMELSSIEEAYKFYNRYACKVGFSVRKASGGKNKRGLGSYRFVCSKNGTTPSAKNALLPIGSQTIQRTPERERGLTRTGCKASCRIRLEKNGLWKVSVFVEEHNHELITSPSKKRNLRSHKLFTKGDMKIVNKMYAQNVGCSQIFEYLAKKKGGKQFVRFRKKDVSNVITAGNRKYLGVDVDTTLVYFQKKKDEDPEFFYEVQPDGNGSIKSIFWVDGRSRRAYQEFGDVVTFDTTYQTNRYSMPLAPFIGVNHHRFSIFFGMALISHEDAETFTWLFNTWLVAMYGKHPKAIITDQDRAMKKAIEIVFPNTLHRCCQWHVMRKARDNFGPLLNETKGFKEELHRVINRTLTVEEFITQWTAMVDRFNLHNHKHLKQMFKTQEEWVPAYFRDTFFADMSTTQRSESMNALFKLWTSNHKSIYQFVLLVDQMIETIWQNESDEDAKIKNEIPKLWSHYQIEVEARQVYTRNVFSVFKEILRESTLGFVHEIKKDMEYQVEIDSHPTITNWVPESYLVKIDKAEGMVSCSCKGFEFEGILCSHAIKVMNQVKMPHLPDRYILKRWTKCANLSVKQPIEVRSNEEGGSMELQTLRFATIKADLMRFAKLGTMNATVFRDLRETIASGTKRFMQLVEIDTTVPHQATKTHQAATGTIPTADIVPKKPLFLDPPDAQCKGKRKKITRFKKPVEMKPKKMRTCSICNSKKGHNARTCPKRQGFRKGLEKGDNEASFDDDSEGTEESQASFDEDGEE